MAKAKQNSNEQKSVVKENLTTENKTEVKEDKDERISVCFLRMLRGSYGSFDKGKKYDVEKTLAERFIKNGVAVKC